jgi:hypothetical protein
MTLAAEDNPEGLIHGIARLVQLAGQLMGLPGWAAVLVLLVIVVGALVLPGKVSKAGEASKARKTVEETK